MTKTLAWMVVAAVVVYALWVRAVGARAKRDDRATGRGEPRQAEPTLPPPPHRVIARWEIDYTDAAGERTRRIVRVKQVQPRAQRLHVWCELRQDDRTLLFSGVRRIVDPETGELLDLNRWIADRASERRRPSGR